MYQGYFINLDQNHARRTALEQHLQQVGAADRYRRVEGILGRAVAHQYQSQLDPGALGLWLTHIKLLEANRGAGKHLHIIEDDTIFCAGAVKKFDRLLADADAQIRDWDLIFTDVQFSPDDVQLFRRVAGKMSGLQPGDVAALDLRPFGFSCMSSFFLNRGSIDKFAQLIADRWTLPLPIDLYVRDLVNQGVLRAWMTIPFLTSVAPAALQSDIRGTLDWPRAISTAYRRAFFAGADVEAIDAELEQLVQGATHSRLANVFLKTLRAATSDQWAHF